MIVKDNYTFIKSPNKLKKYRVFLKNGKHIDFGAIHPDGSPYEQYYDKLKLFKDYNHYDEKRRDRYYQRHKKDYGIDTADWFSKKYLW
jgi:hypothetical protein